jgi:hypothetical protein
LRSNRLIKGLRRQTRDNSINIRQCLEITGGSRRTWMVPQLEKFSVSEEEDVVCRIDGLSNAVDFVRNFPRA